MYTYLGSKTSQPDMSSMAFVSAWRLEPREAAAVSQSDFPQGWGKSILGLYPKQGDCEFIQ